MTLEISELPFIIQLVATMNSLELSGASDKYLNALISANVHPPIKNTRVIFFSGLCDD